MVAKKHGYENVTVDEIRKTLKQDYGITDETVLSQNKGQLITLLTIDDNPLDYDEETASLETLQIHPTEVLVEDTHVLQPAFNTAKWHEWVMLQFEEYEMEGGAPTCDGLRRVTENILGPISKVEIISNSTPNSDNKGNATVVVGITIEPVSLDTHPMYGRLLYVEDIADANKLNTPPEIFRHPSATAGTRAEARAYRKILRLHKILAAEENDSGDVSDEDWVVATPISEQQIQVLELLCERLNLNLLDYINCGQNKHSCVELVTDNVAQRMLQHLNRIQQKDAKVPDNVGVFDKNWRTNSDE